VFNRSSRWSQPYRASSRDDKALNRHLRSGHEASREDRIRTPTASRFVHSRQ